MPTSPMISLIIGLGCRVQLSSRSLMESRRTRKSRTWLRSLNKQMTISTLPQHLVSCHRTVNHFTHLFSGAFLVDYFPSMRFIPSWLPGGKFKTLVPKFKAAFDAMVEKPYERAKQLIVSVMPVFFNAKSTNRRKIRRRHLVYRRRLKTFPREGKP